MTAYDVNLFKINGVLYKLADNSYIVDELSGKLNDSYSYLVSLISNIEPVSYDVTYTTYTGAEVDLSSYVSYSYLDSVISGIVPVTYDVSYVVYILAFINHEIL